jgi:hypothetical protein
VLRVVVCALSPVDGRLAGRLVEVPRYPDPHGARRRLAMVLSILSGHQAGGQRRTLDRRCSTAEHLHRRLPQTGLTEVWKVGEAIMTDHRREACSAGVGGSRMQEHRGIGVLIQRSSARRGATMNGHRSIAWVCSLIVGGLLLIQPIAQGQPTKPGGTLRVAWEADATGFDSGFSRGLQAYYIKGNLFSNRSRGDIPVISMACRFVESNF